MTRWRAIAAVAVAVVLAANDMTIAAVALPEIGREFGAVPALTQWVLLAYFLPMVALGVPIGRWVDGAALRAAFWFATIGFGVSSMAIVLAPTLPLLLAGRAVQGVFAALIAVLGFPVVGAAAQPQHRARAMSVIVTLIPLSAVVGPGLGGVLTDVYGWRSVFLINLPIVAVALALGRGAIPDVRGSARALPLPDRRSIGEALAVGTAVGALLLAIDLVGRGGSTAAVPLGLAVAGIATGIAWLRHPVSTPVIGFLRRPDVGRQVLALTAMVLGFGAAYFLVPYHLADLGWNSATTGVVLLVMALGMAATSPIAGVVADRIGVHRLVLAGTATALVGTVAVAALGPEPHPTDVAWRLAVIGVGNGLFAGPNATAVLIAAPPHQVGTAGGVTALFRTIGFSLGPALGALVWMLTGGGSTAVRVAFVVLSATTVVALVAASRAPRPRRPRLDEAPPSDQSRRPEAQPG